MIFKRIFKTYEELQANLILDSVFESIDLFTGEIRGGTLIIKSMKSLTKSKEKLLRKRYVDKVGEMVKKHNEFMIDIRENSPKRFLSKLDFRLFLKKQDKRMDRFVKKQNIVFEIEPES